MESQSKKLDYDFNELNLIIKDYLLSLPKNQ